MEYLLKVRDSVDEKTIKNLIEFLKDRTDYNVIYQDGRVYLTYDSIQNNQFTVQALGNKLKATPKRGNTTVTERKNMTSLIEEFLKTNKINTVKIPQKEVDMAMRDLREEMDKASENGNKMYLSVAYQHLNLDVKETDDGYSYMISEIDDENAYLDHAETFNDLITGILETVDKINS